MPASAVRSSLSSLSRAAAGASRWIRAAGSSIHGRGVYARVAIPDGTRIVEYTGERITKAEAKRREAQRLIRLRHGGDGSVYIFDLNRRHDLDGRLRTNIARLINHSCGPNCRAETIRGRIWIFARRDIPAGTELTFDYGYSYKECRDHPCRCGAKGCAGFIVNSGSRWRLRRKLRKEAAAHWARPPLSAGSTRGVQADGSAGLATARRRRRRSTITGTSTPIAPSA